MRIALVTFSYSNTGGIERCVRELSRQLSVRHEVHVFASEWNDVPENTVVLHRVPVLKRPWIARHLSFYLLSGIMLKRHQKRIPFDLVHAHNATWYPADVVTAHSVHAAGLRHLYASLSFCGRLWNKFKTIEPLLLWLARYNYAPQRAKMIIAISGRIRDEVVHHYNIDHKRIQVIYNGLTMPCQKHAEDGKREPAEKRLLFVANEFERKGLRTVLTALSLLPHQNIHLDVVGRSSPDDHFDYAAYAAELNIGRSVCFHGISRQVENFYQHADLFVLPTRYEPFGMVIAEAMAASLPVITSSCAGAAELIIDRYNGRLLKNPESAGELAEILHEILSSPQGAGTMGAHARETMRNYSWTAIALQTENLYTKVRHDAYIKTICKE